MRKSSIRGSFVMPITPSLIEFQARLMTTNNKLTIQARRCNTELKVFGRIKSSATGPDHGRISEGEKKKNSLKKSVLTVIGS